MVDGSHYDRIHNSFLANIILTCLCGKVASGLARIPCGVLVEGNPEKHG